MAGPVDHARPRPGKFDHEYKMLLQVRSLDQNLQNLLLIYLFFFLFFLMKVFPKRVFCMHSHTPDLQVNCSELRATDLI